MSFKHKTFPRTNNQHTYSGSLVRHIVIENCFNFLSIPTSLMFKITRNVTMYKLSRIFFVIVWGLNCNFPVKDVFQYVVFWTFKKSVPEPKNPFYLSKVKLRFPLFIRKLVCRIWVHDLKVGYCAAPSSLGDKQHVLVGSPYDEPPREWYVKCVRCYAICHNGEEVEGLYWDESEPAGYRIKHGKLRWWSLK